jgi:hypothetical protein
MLRDFGSAYLLRIVDLKPSHLFEVPKKTPEPGEHGGHGGGGQGFIQETAFI